MFFFSFYLPVSPHGWSWSIQAHWDLWLTVYLYRIIFASLTAIYFANLIQMIGRISWHSRYRWLLQMLICCHINLSLALFICWISAAYQVSDSKLIQKLSKLKINSIPWHKRGINHKINIGTGYWWRFFLNISMGIGPGFPYLCIPINRLNPSIPMPSLR